MSHTKDRVMELMEADDSFDGESWLGEIILIQHQGSTMSHTSKSQESQRKQGKTQTPQSNPMTTTPSPTEREKFEAWCKKDNPKYQPADDGMSNRRDWLVWQAALSGAAVQPAEKATCQTCEALARAVMMDQVGRAA